MSEDGTPLPVKTSKGECFPRKFAVKIVRNDDPEKISATRLEYDLLKILKHPNIITVHDFFMDSFKNTAYLVMEYVAGCEVLELLSTSEHGLPESDACRLFAQLILAIDCLHKNRVCHRDIKPENILVTSDRQRVVLIDFNVSKKVLGADAGLNMYTKCVGSIAFAAPERLKQDQKAYSEKVDLWAAGLVLTYLLTGSHPFAEFVESVPKTIEQILNSEKVVASFLQRFPGLSAPACDMIKRLLSVDP